MALDIGIQAPSNSKDPLERDLVVSLEEGDLAFLYTLIEEVRSKTGVAISSCDDARLQGAQLDLWRSLVLEKVEEAKSKPNKWDENIGYMLKPEKKPMYETISKAELLSKLNNLLVLTEKAARNEKVLFFFGD